MDNPYKKVALPEISNEQNIFRETNIWSYHLHKLLGTTEVINLSINGSSNHRIVRTTLDFFTKLLGQNKTLDDYVAIIQWTDTSRFELFDNELDTYLNITNTHIRPRVDGNRQKLLNSRLAEHPKNFEQDWLVQLICLSSFFKQHNIKYLFTTMDERNLPNEYCSRLNWLSDNSYDRQILNSTNFRYPFKHPDLQGHQIIAKRLYEKLQNIYSFC